MQEKHKELRVLRGKAKKKKGSTLKKDHQRGKYDRFGGDGEQIVRLWQEIF